MLPLPFYLKEIKLARSALILVLTNCFLIFLRKPLALVTLSDIVPLNVPGIHTLISQLLDSCNLNNLTSQSSIFNQWSFYPWEEWIVQSLTQDLSLCTRGQS